MAFDREFKLQIMPRIASVLLTLFLAAILRSYWALLVGIMLQRVLRVALSYAMHSYRPRFSLAAWRDLAGFSAWAWAIMLAHQIRERSENIVIGRMLDAHQVGLYETGKEIALLPTSELVQPACHAIYTGFAQSHNAGGNPGEACLRVIAILVLVSLPAGFGLSSIAAPLVRLAFGPDWLDAIPIIQAFGIAGAAAGFGAVCSTLLRAHGLMSLSFRMSIISVPVRIALPLVLIPLGGLPAAAAGIAGAVFLGRFTTLIVTFRHFGIRFSELTRRVWRSVAAVCIMAGALWWTGLGWNSSAPETLSACAAQMTAAMAIGSMAYGFSVLTLWILSGRPSGGEADAMELARNFLTSSISRPQGR